MINDRPLDYPDGWLTHVSVQGTRRRERRELYENQVSVLRCKTGGAQDQRPRRHSDEREGCAGMSERHAKSQPGFGG
jgi:hypothetical protein